MARFYSDENVPQPVVAELRRLGHDVLTVVETGAANRAIPDEEVLAFAAENGRTVLTLNRKDFIRLHREQPNHAGIVICTFDVDFERQARRIHAAVNATDELSGALLRVNRKV